MIALIALLLQAAAPAPAAAGALVPDQVKPVPMSAAPAPSAVPDGRTPLSLWIGGDSRLSFEYGRALSRALAASPKVRQAVPIDTARYRLVVRRLPRPTRRQGRFAYAMDVIRPVSARHRHEHVVHTLHGRCTSPALDACATQAVTRLASRLGS